MEKSSPNSLFIGYYLLITLSLFHLLSESVAVQQPKKLSAVAIMEKVVEVNKLEGVEMLSTLIIYNAKGEKRVRKTATVSKLYDQGATEKRLIRFIAPADVKGTGLLTYDYEKKDDDIWLFLPALRKTRRIVTSEKAKNFMGSEFTYADLTPPSVEDFSHTLLPQANIGGVLCWVIESTPQSQDIADENGFSKKISYIGQTDYIARKVIYFDLDQKLEKELNVSDVQEIDPEKKRCRPLQLVIENKQNQRRSELKIEKIRLRKDIPDDYFTTRYLERL